MIESGSFSSQTFYFVNIMLAILDLFLLHINFRACLSIYMGFPNSSVGKESACKAGDPSLIPRLGRAAGEGIGYPLQYS